MSHNSYVDPGNKFWNCCAREVAEARCPPPVSEERKRTLSARGLAVGLIIWRAGEDSASSSAVVGSGVGSLASLVMQSPLLLVAEFDLVVSTSSSLGMGFRDSTTAAACGSDTWEGLWSFVGSDSVRVS